MKTCSKCKQEKYLTEFNKKKEARDGLDSYCKSCRKKISKLNYTKYKEKWSEYCRTYRENNPEKAKESQKKALKNYYKKNKVRLKEHSKDYYVKNRDNILDKRNSIRNLNTFYNSYITEAIAWHDYTECSEDGFLIVKCKYCGKKFKPKNKATYGRAAALNSLGTDTNALYCSSGCKKACPTFHQKFNYKGQKVEGSSREVQPELRQMCLERDNYTCQKCWDKGNTVQLHCHHIYPLNESPITSADVDTTITLCKECHKDAHKIHGCGYHELRCDSIL